MKIISFVLGAYASVALIGCSGPDSLTQQSMNAAVAKTPTFSGVAAVAYSGEITFSVAKGVANQETGELVTIDTRLNIGPAGKFLTMPAVAKMRDEGRLVTPSQHFVRDLEMRFCSSTVWQKISRSNLVLLFG